MDTGSSERSLRRHILFIFVLGLAFVGGIGGWAATTTLSNAVIGEGTVVIEDNVKKIQHLTGGIVSELLVKEGTHVTAGQVLLRLDGTALTANLAIMNSTLAQLYARRTRLHAERSGATSLTVADIAKGGVDVEANKQLVDGELQLFETRRSAIAGMKKQLEERKGQLAEEIKGQTVQLKAIEDAIALINEEYVAISSLYEKQIVTMQRVNALKRQRAELDGGRGERLAARAQSEGRINEINLQILQLDEDRRSENAKDLTDIEARAAETEERRAAILDQMKRLELRAPMDGRIYQLAVHTVGGVVNPGETLMLLAPDSRSLTVEAKIATRNIDQVAPGQSVNVRFSAFDQRTTPEVEGEVVSIAPDVVVDQRTGISFYPVRIKPSETSLSNLHSMSLYPGMPAEVFIKVADRSVTSYFLKPLTDQISHTFREE